jgi:hypothetical protein
MISGTNGLSGGVDTIFVLSKSKRCSSNATLYCSGRDIEEREIELKFNKDNCTWECVSDSSESPEMLLPIEMQELIGMMKELSFFSGSNTEFLEQYQAYSGRDIKANSLKRMMNRWRSELEDSGVFFESCKRNNTRSIDIFYEPPERKS